MRWFRRKSPNATSPESRPLMASKGTPPRSPGSFAFTPSMNDVSSQLSTSPTTLLSPTARLPINDEKITGSNKSSLFRRNTSQSWTTTVAHLLSGIPERKEVIGPLTDICGAIGMILERRGKTTVHKAAWDAVFSLLETHRRKFSECLNLFISDDTLPELESPLFVPLKNYAIELESMAKFMLTEGISGTRSPRRSSLSQSVRKGIQTSEHMAVTAERVEGHVAQLEEYAQEFLLSAMVYNGLPTPGAKENFKASSISPYSSISHRVAWTQGLHHSECLSGTRVAILSEIYAWANNFEENTRIFCLVDFEGTGKSTIANHVARKWQAEGRLAGRFFFSQGFTGASTASDFPLFLAGALRATFPELEDQLQRAQGNLKQAVALPIPQQWNRLVVSSLQLIGDRPLVIVVDGLNECSTDSREQLLNCILETFRSSETLRKVKIFLTTRSNPGMERLLRGAGNAARIESLMSTPSQKRSTLQDISHYIHHRMSHVQGPGMSEQDYEALVTRSGGRFIFAATACTILLRSRHRRACLRRIIGANDSDALSALYLSTLRYASDLDEACSVAHLMLFLSVVVAIRQPLPLPIIVELLPKATPINVTRIIENLAGLVSGGIQGEPIRVIHPTFREFLLRASISQEYSINLNMAHAILAKSCLSLISQSLKTDICSLSTPGEPFPLNDDIRKLEAKLDNCIMPQIQYAALNWSIHATFSIHTPAVLQLTRQFFTRNILNWLELGFLCGLETEYVIGLSNLQIAIENNLLLRGSCVNDTDKQWCQDVIQFTGANEALLEVSVLQLYTSAVAFTSNNNLVSRHYAAAFKSVFPSIPRGFSGTQNGPLVLRGHREAVTCVAYSVDGLGVVSGSKDGTLILWDVESGSQITTMPGNSSPIQCLSYSPRGNFVVFGAEDGYIRKWDGTESEAVELGSLDMLEAISSLSWSPSGLELTGGTSSGSLWGLSMLFSSEVNDYGQVHSDAINSIAYSPSGDTIASASSDCAIKLWHVDTLERSSTPKFILEHVSPVYCVAFSPNRPVLVSGTTYFHIWKVDTGEEIFRGVREGILRCLAYSPDGSQVITTHGPDIRQRETNTRSFTGSKFKGHTGDITCVAYSPGGDFIVSGSEDRSLHLWNLCDADLERSVGHKTVVTSLSFSQDGKFVASAASDGTFCLWNAEKAVLRLGPIYTPLGKITAIAYCPDKELVACAGEADYVALWSTKRGIDTGVKLPRRFEATSVNRITFSPNSAFIAVKADLNEEVLFIWAITNLGSPTPVKLAMRVNANGKYAFHSSSKYICIGDKAWNLQNSSPKLVSAEEELQAILLETFHAEISYKYDHGLDWIYIGDPPRQSFALPSHFNVTCHAIHSRMAVLGGDDGNVVFIDCHKPVTLTGWRLVSDKSSLTLDVEAWTLPGPDGVSMGSSPTLNGDDLKVPSGCNDIPSDSQAVEARDTAAGNASPASIACAVPDLTGSVRKLQRKPVFNGTYSTVYEGELDGKKVAIKALRAVNSLHAMRRKYRRELETWWRLVHPNVTPLLGSIEDEELGDFGILISPWAERGNAANYIELDINFSQRINLFLDVSKGLKYLHEFNPTVVHADLKPANVLIDGDGTARLCDFGLVRIVQKEADTHTGMTTTTAHAGTARYLAYELVESLGLGDNLPTTASDVHALACIGMEFIYIRPPYAEIRSNQRMAQHRICKAIGKKFPPANRPQGIAGFVANLWDAFEMCWHTEASFRPSAAEICDYLAENGAALAAGLIECKDCGIEPRDILM